MKRILISGAAGELGQALIKSLLNDQSLQITCLDIRPIPDNLINYTRNNNSFRWLESDISDKKNICNFLELENFDTIFHLAALLSSTAAQNPTLAHKINIEATQYILEKIKALSTERRVKTRVIFPSSIAVFGMDSVSRELPVHENELLFPITLYGKQKLEIEKFGSKLAENSDFFEFKSLRFPGILSSETIPTGGTSDYAPLMIHMAAKKEAYSCFVSPETTLSFIAMPDAISALINIAKTSSDRLKRNVYNLHGFSISAKEIYDLINIEIPNSKINFVPNLEKQKIVESWPAILDCQEFIQDSGWCCSLNKNDCFSNYLFPEIFQKYKQ